MQTRTIIKECGSLTEVNMILAPPSVFYVDLKIYDDRFYLIIQITYENE